MKKFRFLEWQVYKDSQGLFSLILNIVKKLPKEFRFELGSQFVRSALSVILNIAEGSGKNSDKELNRYFNISLGSLHEVLAIIDTLKNNNLVTTQEYNEIFNRAENIANQLGGFKKRLHSD